MPRFVLLTTGVERTRPGRAACGPTAQPATRSPSSPQRRRPLRGRRRSRSYPCHDWNPQRAHHTLNALRSATANFARPKAILIPEPPPTTGTTSNPEPNVQDEQDYRADNVQRTDAGAPQDPEVTAVVAWVVVPSFGAVFFVKRGCGRVGGVVVAAVGPLPPHTPLSSRPALRLSLTTQILKKRQENRPDPVIHAACEAPKTEPSVAFVVGGKPSPTANRYGPVLWGLHLQRKFGFPTSLHAARLTPVVRRTPPYPPRPRGGSRNLPLPSPHRSQVRA